jgi:hypothetical protein
MRQLARGADVFYSFETLFQSNVLWLLLESSCKSSKHWTLMKTACVTCKSTNKLVCRHGSFFISRVTTNVLHVAVKLISLLIITC